MSSTADAMSKDFDPADPSLAPQIAAPIFADVSEPAARAGMFSIFDQAVVSGANFLTTVMIARACSQDEVGVYSLAWTVVLFLAAVQANLISVPYTMYHHRRGGDSLAEYGGSALVHQLITSAAAVACFAGLAMLLSLGVGPAGLRPAAWVLCGVVPFILLRDYLRRFSFAHLAMGTAVAMDVVAAALQLGTLLALWRLGRLSAATGYVAMGSACAAAGLGWWLLSKQPIRFSRRVLVRDWRRNWSFGKWALTSQMTGLAFYLLPWLLAAVHGEAQTGELAACTTLVGLSNLFVMGLNNFLMPKAAQAFARGGVRATGGVLRKAALCSMVVLGTLCVVVFFVGNRLAGALFGPEYADTGLLLTVLALAAFTDALGLTASSGLWAMDRPATNFAADLLQMLVMLAAALWLVLPLGAVGIGLAIVGGAESSG